jgi:hypothetical protein
MSIIVHTYMLYKKSGKDDIDDLSSFTVSAAKIVQNREGISLYGPDGSLTAELILSPDVKIRVVGE